MNLEDKIRQAIIAALKNIPELQGGGTENIEITVAGLSYHVEFNVPLPVPFGGA